MPNIVDITHVRTWEDARRILMPTARSVSFVGQMQADLDFHSGDSLPCFDVADGLYGTLVLDLPTQMAHVTDSMLADWGVRFETAFETALTRLEGMSVEPFDRLGECVWAAPWRDHYAAARVLLPEVVQRVCPSPYVAVPDRDNLIVGSGPAGFEQLVLMIANCQAQEVITRNIYQLVDATLVEIEPPDTPIGLLYEELLMMPLD